MSSAPVLLRLVRRPVLPWLVLLISLALHVLVTALGADPFKMVDLEVYVAGAAHLSDGTLYDFVTEPLKLPFTYPPFAAVLFSPLSWLPWWLARVLWQIASVAALAGIVALTLRLVGARGRPDPVWSSRGIVLVLTGVAIWAEPVRTTLNYGQINLFLAVLLLAGAVAVRGPVAGATVGLAAAIKLTPAITGLFYLLERRWSAVVGSVLTFAASVAVMLAVLPDQTWRFFTELMLDPSRTGPVYSAINQSWRGALARIAQADDVTVSWYVAVVVSVGLGVWAAVAALRIGDRAAAFLAIQLVGLLVSPISWSHHWVWVVPVLLWAVTGDRRADRWARAIAIGWTVAVFSYLVPILIAVQELTPVRPWYESALALVYPLLGTSTLVVILLRSRRAALGAGRRPA